MGGTLKLGGAARANTTTVIQFVRPAGKRLTLNTAKDTETSAEVATNEGHGDGSVGPYAIFHGEGKATWKTSIAQHEMYQLMAIAAGGGVPLLGDGGVRFDLVQTTVLDGVPKMTKIMESCSIAKEASKIAGDGNMVDLEGPCLNIVENGVPRFRKVV